jgi:hypothetical protein
MSKMAAKVIAEHRQQGAIVFGEPIAGNSSVNYALFFNSSRLGM